MKITDWVGSDDEELEDLRRARRPTSSRAPASDLPSRRPIVGATVEGGGIVLCTKGVNLNKVSPTTKITCFPVTFETPKYGMLLVMNMFFTF